MNGIWWNKNKVNIDNVFVYIIALKVININEDHESKSTKDGRQSENWPKWKYIIKVELSSLYKQHIFGPLVQTPQGVKSIRYK